MNCKPWLALALVSCIENTLSAPVDRGVPVDTADPVAVPGSETGDPTGTEDQEPPQIAPCVDLETLEVSLDFPARQDCPWGVGDNLTQLNEQNRARAEEIRELVLPDGAQLCDLSFRSLSSDVLFDDHVTITLDDVVLVGGGYGYGIEVLPVVANLPRYRWENIVGRPFLDRGSPYFCLGEPDSVCVLPVTEVAGPLEISLSEAASGDLVAAMVGRTTLPFRVITFGDDDEDDCAHTDLTLQVAVQYTSP